ncbi:MAG: hypothetical protein CME62_17645 [Halobacteriovoraceae bacterium]|nr:hypothetical protein [Halobacteriovoraceae bacterium]
MKIYALDSENQDYLDLIDQISQKVSIDIFETIDDLIESVADDCGGVLLDFDSESRKKNKMITTLKKEFDNLNIFLFANSLNAKKLAKHQNSKTGAHLYFQTPMDDVVLDTLLETFFEIEEFESGDQDHFESTTDRAASILSTQNNTMEFSDKASEINSKINKVFESAGFSSLNQPDLTAPDSLEPNQVDEPSAADEGELSLGEVSLSSDLDNEISLDDDEADSLGEDEITLGEDQEDDGIGLEATGVNELSLDDGESDEGFELGEENVEVPQEMGHNDISLDDSEGFELSDDNQEDGLNLSEAGDELDLSDNGDELSLSTEEGWEDNAELSLDDDADTEEEAKLPSEDDLTFPDFEQPEALHEQDEQDELSLSEETDSEEDHNEADLSLLDSTGEFDLSLSDSGEAAIEKPDDELEFSLSSVDEENSAGDMNTGVDILSGMDEELSLSESESEDLTRPTSIENLQEDSVQEGDLSINASQEYENPDSASIDELLAQSEAEVAAEKELDPDVYQEEEEDEDDATIVGVAMSQRDRKQVEQNQLGEIEHQKKVDDSSQLEELEALDDFEEDELTSVAINHDLSSVDLPSEMPEFSTSVAKKLDDIDEMMDDEIQGVENTYQSEDNTLVASDAEEKTTLTQEISPEPNEDEQEQTVATARRGQNEVSQDLKDEHREYVKTHDDELIRLGETIKSLREDREQLLAKIHKFESKQDAKDENFISLKAELDEKKIEVAVIKKRMEKQIDDLRFQLDISLDKKEYYAKQNEELAKQVETLTKQSKLDVNKVRYRERELEEKLEMLRRDAEIQIQNRDKKILELKRRIDTLEFDIESAQLKEKSSVDSQHDLEERMNRVIKTLRGAIGQLEDDYGAEERIAKLRKNMDL